MTKKHATIAEIRGLQYTSDDQNDLSEFCRALLQLFDNNKELYCDAVDDAFTREDAFAKLWEVFCNSCESLCEAKAHNCSDLIAKISVWRRLAPEAEDSPTIDEALLTSIIRDIDAMDLR